MGQKSFKKNYVLIYFWQSLSILLGFVSLFVVIPFLSSNKELYAIYSVCTSLTIFFSYADLGFISAGVKFAAEYYINGDKNNEIKIVGFVAFIMLTSFSLVAIGIFILGLFPQLLIPDITSGSEQWITARWLLIVMAFSCPILIGQRILNMIFSIRIEDYKYQRIMIIGNIIRILSIFYFFSNGEYKLIQYFIFYQIINLLVVLVAFIYIKKYNYNFLDLAKNFKFNKDVFNKTKKLSGTSLTMIICMIFYYELDQIAITRLIGLDAVAYYAIALSLMSFVRTFMSLLYSPYSVRYNYYSGTKDIQGLINFVKKIIWELAPFVFSPIIILSVTSAPFIISWVGEGYSKASLLISIMAISFIPNFISTPVSSYLIAVEDNKRLIYINILNVILYWLGIILLVNFINIYSFAIMKSLSPIIIMFLYWVIMNNRSRSNNIDFIKPIKLIMSLLPIVTISVISSLIVKHYMLYEHNKVALLINLLLMGMCLFISIFTAFLSNKEINSTIKSLIKK